MSELVGKKVVLNSKYDKIIEIVGYFPRGQQGYTEPHLQLVIDGIKIKVPESMVQESAIFNIYAAKAEPKKEEVVETKKPESPPVIEDKKEEVTVKEEKKEEEVVVKEEKKEEPKKEAKPVVKAETKTTKKKVN